MSQQVIRSKIFKDEGVYIDQLSEIILECIKNSKNISIYSQFGRNRPMKRFIFDQQL